MGHDQPVTLAIASRIPVRCAGRPRQKSGRRIDGGFVNESHVLGHRLRDGARFPGTSTNANVTGRDRRRRHGRTVRGLAARQAGMRDFVVLEMEPTAGGNARWGENEVAAYPWAAHYVPVPGRAAGLVRELFTDLGVFDGERWDERHLVHAPRERLFIHGRWQEGLDPAVGPTQRDRDQFARFDERIAKLSRDRAVHDPDGRWE